MGLFAFYNSDTLFWATIETRAEYLRKYLTGRGVDESRIEVIVIGGTDVLSPANANRNCKVELLADTP